MSRTNPHRLKVDQRVRIVQPLRFLRCGYPMSLADGEKFVRDNFSPQITALFEAVRGTAVTHLLNSWTTDRDRDAVVRRLAHAHLQVKGFGGKQRTLHTEELPELTGGEFIVSSIRRCQTGVREPGYYDPEEGGEPAYLTELQVHTILEGCDVWPATSQTGTTIHGPLFNGPFAIEACHCEPCP